MAHQVSPLAPAAFPHLPPIAGVRLAAAETGIRYKNRPDVLLAVMDPGTSVAGCFTRSKSRSAPVDWCAESLKGGTARAVVINAGNANAFTGKAGVATVTAVAKSAAQASGLQAGRNLPGLDRRHRRAARPLLHHQRAAEARRRRRAGRLVHGRQGHHDDRHLPQGRDRQGEARRQDRHHQRHRQGLRHDRAGHGDDAGLHLHRRGTAARRSCRSC